MHIQHIEEATLNAWPALQQILYDGWVVRFANGYTKRANSVTTLYSGVLDLDRKIAWCEEWYAARQVPTVFRLPSFAAPPTLDALLEARGYRLIDETLGLTRPLAAPIAVGESPATLHLEAIDEWLPLYSDFNKATASQQRNHRLILDGICGQRALFTLRIDGAAVACGLGVLEDVYFGLFDIVVTTAQRERGYGTQLVSGMLSWAQTHGAAHAHLQVVKANAPARHLYAKAGFVEAYQYWYRVAGG